MVTWIGQWLAISASLIPAPVVPQGIGPAYYLAIEDSSAISGGITSVQTIADVDALVAASEISAQAATDIEAILGQSTPPDIVWIATYDTGTSETPDDALDALELAGHDGGVIAQESRSNTDNELVGGWVNATSRRRWGWVACLQSSEAELITSGRPAALEDAEVLSVNIHYHDTDAEPCAAAHAGVIAGHDMRRGPLPQQVRLLGVALPSITSAELAFAKANGVCVLLPLGSGASASQRAISQTTTYDGSEAAAIYTMIYSIRRIRAVMYALAQRLTAEPRLLRADQAGATEVVATLTPPLEAMADAGHFVPGVSGATPNDTPVPRGYLLSATPSGSEILASVYLRLGPEVTKVRITETGEIVVEA